ncbi:MAG: PAS domain-containing protein [Clostridiales bacterium]|nr:PAS domain-containing protein [Clostridiales bacterium]
MYKKIFRSVCISAFTVLAASLLLIMGVLYQYFENQIRAEIRTEAGYIARAVDLYGEEYLAGLEPEGRRFTLISQDGTVLYDSGADPSGMDNHLGREEIDEALRLGRGESVRYSDTLTQRTLYCAVRLENGDVLRISMVQHSVLTLLLGIMQPVAVVILIGLGVSAVMASRVSGSIVQPLNHIDLDHPADTPVYDELAPMISRISRQRRTIERQLAEAEQMQREFRMITENMTEGFLVIDSGTEVLSWNSAALRLLGVAPGQFTGGSVLTLNRSEDFRTAVDAALAGEHCERSTEVGGRVYSLLANPVTQDGTTIGAVLLMVDVTEQTRREQLRREFTANVSHELKTPLTSISGFAELMRSGGVPPEDVADFAGRIYDEAGRLITLVGDIIKLSELDEGAPAGEDFSRVELAPLAGDVLRRLEPQAAGAGVTLTLTGGGSVWSSGKILDEILYNLCDNAIKYNRPGGSVTVSILPGAGRVRLTVEDTGIGIPAADQQRVFERFYRVDKSHSREIGGTGLGLSIVKHGAAAIGAGLTLESTPGEGTRVTLTLPDPPEHAGPAASGTNGF